MKEIKSPALILALIFVSQIINAQSNSRTYNFKDFDKVQIENINGEVAIVLGKTFGITVSGNDNAEAQVQVTKSEDKLLVKLDNQFVSDWKNRKTVTVKISMPEISKLYNSSNADVSVQYFAGRYFGIQNNGNGNITITGSIVDFIEIKNNGNGNVETKNLAAKKVDISKSGNGDVNIRTDSNFSVEMAGNGDVVNYGNGKAIMNKQSGNGKVVYRNQ
jgi:hypothetical protein